MCIHYSLLRRLASYKVCLCFIVLSEFVLYGMVVNILGIKFSYVDLVKFLKFYISLHDV